MRIDGVPYRTIWVDPDDGWSIRVIDQTKLPWSLEIVRLADVAQAAHAIRSMQVRGAPLIGAAAAYGLCLGLRRDASSEASAMRHCLRRRGQLPSTFAGRSSAC
jgi:methylthioribose-1-phosphate isomerase